jgi:hypothetical protein
MNKQQVAKKLIADILFRFIVCGLGFAAAAYLIKHVSINIAAVIFSSFSAVGIILAAVVWLRIRVE